MPTPDLSGNSILPAVGFHAGIPYDVYSPWPAINFSRLKAMKRTPAHCRYEMDNPKPPTPALIMGNALHAAVFEPAKFAAQFAPIEKVDRRTNEGKARYKELEALNAGRTMLDPDDMGAVSCMANAIRSKSASAKFIEAAGQTELAAVWKDRETGLSCKGKFDKLVVRKGPSVLLELKSTRDASRYWFGRDVQKLSYAPQAKSYLIGHEAITGEKAIHVIVAVENVPPYGVAIYTLGDRTLQTGAALYRQWLRRYAECLSSGVWPDYPNKVEELDMPMWDDVEMEEEAA